MTLQEIAHKVDETGDAARKHKGSIVRVICGQTVTARLSSGRVLYYVEGMHIRKSFVASHVIANRK